MSAATPPTAAEVDAAQTALNHAAYVVALDVMHGLDTSQDLAKFVAANDTYKAIFEAWHAAVPA